MPLRPLTNDIIDHYRGAGLWIDKLLYRVLDGHAAHSPDHLAVVDQHERLTYAELVRRSHNLAAWMLAQGWEPGTPVALQSNNRTTLAVMHFACNRADMLFLPLSSAWREREMVHLLGQARAKALFVPAADDTHDYVGLIEAVRSQLPELDILGVIEGDSSIPNLSDISQSGGATVEVEGDPNVPRFIMVASGTTELPKMSLWTDNNLWAFLKQYREATGMRSDDIALGMAPANTGATGYVFPVLAPILQGATSVLLEDWSPSGALNLMESEQVTMATAVPTQILKLFEEDGLADRDFQSLRVFTNAGAAMPPDAAKRMEEVFGCIGQVVYGATDGGVAFMTRVEDPAQKRHSTVGRPVAEGEVRLLDPEGRDVEGAASGEITWRSPTKTFGYFNDDDRTAAAWIDDGWYRSGDLGEFDSDGYLRIIGRVKDMIIRGGQNISPREIEDVIMQHPSVAEVSVVGLPDPVYGERACACIVLRKGQSLEITDLLEFMKGQGIAKFKLPERVEFFDEFPSSAGGKITKVELRRLLEERN